MGSGIHLADPVIVSKWPLDIATFGDSMVHSTKNTWPILLRALNICDMLKAFECEICHLFDSPIWLNCQYNQ